MRFVVLLTVFSALTSSPAIAAERILQLLGPIDGRSTVAHAINDRGDVVGSAFDATGNSVPVIWTQRGYDKFLGDVYGDAVDINNRGEVIGFYAAAAGMQIHGFLWSETAGMIDLGSGFWPIKINDAGVIAGRCGDPNRDAPCVWVDGATTLLNTPFAGTPVAINNRGDVAGYIFDLHAPSERDLPVVWHAGGELEMLPMRSGTLEAPPTGINNHGTVVGLSYAPFDEPNHWVTIWNPDGTLAESPDDIDAVGVAVNDAGVIVGITAFPNSTSPRGFTWTAGGQPRYLTGGDGSAPVDINARGDIAGVIYVGTTSYAAVWREASPLRITTPNTPSRWGLNTTQRLAWTYEGDAPAFLIEVNRDGGEAWDFVASVPNKPGPSQNFYWNVTGPATDHARLRVTAVGDDDATDDNDADIRIAPAAINFILPNRSTVAEIGKTQTIFFSHNLGAEKPVAIDVSGDGGGTWRTVVARTLTRGADTSSFRWSVDLVPTGQARIRIRSLERSAVVGISESFYVIGGVPGPVSTSRPSISGR